jgi:hypothetical protein
MKKLTLITSKFIRFRKMDLQPLVVLDYYYNPDSNFAGLHAPSKSFLKSTIDPEPRKILTARIRK